MNIVGKGELDNFKRKHADARSKVESWVAEVEAAAWEKPLDIKQKYPEASFLSNNQVIFDLKGNRYRLWTIVSYKNKTVLIKKAGTHEKYMKWGTR
jgi:mRNA interferase HigB